MEKTWHRFYDEGVPLEVDPPKDPLPVQLERAARDFPQTTATEFVGARLTYRQLADDVNRFAASLSQLGVKAGDRVAIMLPNCPQTIITYYAVLSIGGVAVMTNPMYVEREMIHQFNDAERCWGQSAGGSGSSVSTDRQGLERDTGGTPNYHQYQGLPPLSSQSALPPQG